jgi:uncharacterized membrane protein YbhN (UPF0104 family)
VTGRTSWRWARVLLGVAVLALLVWRLGTGPFVEGLQQVDARVLLVGLLVGTVTTACAAWRWRAVSLSLGVPLPLVTAVMSSYRAQFLNTVLPGGVLGDVHRGVRHGRDTGGVGRGLRAVLWDRTTGQVVQVALTVAALALLPSPVDAWVPAVAAVLVVAVLASGLVLGRRGSRTGYVARVALADLRAVGGAWGVVGSASLLAVSGYVLTFLGAARSVGVDVPLPRLVPLALLLLLAMSIPFNVAGWGPREGAAAWVFAAAGLGASTGVSAAVVYGVMSFVGALPGALVLVGSWLRSTPRVAPRTGHTGVPLEGAQHG